MDDIYDDISEKANQMTEEFRDSLSPDAMRLSSYVMLGVSVENDFFECFVARMTYTDGEVKDYEAAKSEIVEKAKSFVRKLGEEVKEKTLVVVCLAKNEEEEFVRYEYTKNGLIERPLDKDSVYML